MFSPRVHAQMLKTCDIAMHGGVHPPVCLVDGRPAPSAAPLIIVASAPPILRGIPSHASFFANMIVAEAAEAVAVAEETHRHTTEGKRAGIDGRGPRKKRRYRKLQWQNLSV